MDGQTGFCIVLTVRNQDGGNPWATVEDVTFSKCVTRDTISVIQVLGVTVASSGVRPELRGDAVAVTGSLRALALFVSPIGIAALLPVIGLGAAVFVVSLAMLAPLPIIARAGTSTRT